MLRRCGLGLCLLAWGAGASPAQPCDGSCAAPLASSPSLLQRSHRVAKTLAGEAQELELLLRGRGARAAQAPEPEPCTDDAGYRDPTWHDNCATWGGFVCTGHTFSEELLRACPVACRVACPPAQQPTIDPPVAPTSEPAHCQSWMLDSLSDECFLAAFRDSQCSVFASDRCKSEWEGLHGLIAAGTCEAESAELASELLETKVGDRTLFAIILELGSLYGSSCTQGSSA